MTPHYYFGTIAFVDSVKNLDYMSTVYNQRFSIIIDNQKNDLLEFFSSKVKSQEIQASLIDGARDKYFPTSKTTPISKDEISDFFRGLGKELILGYLFFGLLIFLGSVNRVMRSSYNQMIFDPRERRDFLVGLITWPLRVTLWFFGEVSVRRYRHDVFTLLNHDEKDLLYKYIKSFGVVSIDAFFADKNIPIRHSFLYALFGLVLGLFVFSVEVYPQSLKDKENVEITTCNSPPLIIYTNNRSSFADMLCVFLEGKGCVEIRQKSVNNFVYSFFYKKIFQKVPWLPPRMLQIN